jgi:hypothetical protein
MLLSKFAFRRRRKEMILTEEEVVIAGIPKERGVV